jgi:hypothetical protein
MRHPHGLTQNRLVGAGGGNDRDNHTHLGDRIRGKFQVWGMTAGPKPTLLTNQIQVVPPVYRRLQKQTGKLVHSENSNLRLPSLKWYSLGSWLKLKVEVVS